MFSPTDIHFDCERAEVMKVFGNESFHAGDYTEAGVRYNDALSVAAPFHFPPQPHHPMKQVVYETADLNQ